jgi:tetratricopeptide (TPR) repeat protein
MSWRDYSDLADKSYKDGDFGAAAKNYKAAWQKKNSKIDLLNKAAQCYYQIKNYKEAASAFEKVSKKSKVFPGSILDYAKALKQDGAYQKSIDVFESYIKNYSGDNKPQQQEIVNREIEGSKMALAWIQDTASSAYKVKYAGQVINSSFTDYAPVPFGDNVLYFSSNRKGKSKIYKSEWDGSSWSKPSIPSIFPKEEKDHFGNGSFNSDFSRFYYTKCIEVPGKDGPVSKCDIYVIIKNGEKWQEPLKMRDYINDSIATTTHPNVSQFGNKEILYFSSNRPGGYGGQDIWYSERELSSDDIDFTVPKNCGPAINTFGDEITPWFSSLEGKLYYASSGMPGAGGLDIFYNQGMGKDWKKSINMGFPVNSPADDFYFIKNSDFSSGYLVSNRTFGDLKKTTDNEDIFRFDYINYQNIFSGKIFDDQSDKLLKDARVTIYELYPDGTDKLVDTRISPLGDFAFAVDASKKYKAKFEKFDYSPQFFRFTTTDTKGNKINQNINLEPEKEAIIATTETKIQEKQDLQIIKKVTVDKKNQASPPAKIKSEKPIETKPEPQVLATSQDYIKRPPSFIKEDSIWHIRTRAGTRQRNGKGATSVVGRQKRSN